LPEQYNPHLSEKRADLPNEGPLLISFYRGEWYPFINLSSKLCKIPRRIKAKGVTLITISPEFAKKANTTTEKHDLKFPVLSSVGNKITRRLGIVSAARRLASFFPKL